MNFRKQKKKYGSLGIPEFGFIRLRQIIGDSKADPPIPPIIPVCASSWWAGIKKSIYPAPVKLGPNTTTWKVEDIRALIDRINEQETAA